MKVVELRISQQVSDFPIKECTNLNIYSEYFLVNKKSKDVFILRYYKGFWVIISLKSFYIDKLELPFSYLFEQFDVYCIPEYTGGSDGIIENDRESTQERKKLLQFLISRYF